jgi:hypothetical protein
MKLAARWTTPTAAFRSSPAGAKVSLMILPDLLIRHGTPQKPAVFRVKYAAAALIEGEPLDISADLSNCGQDAFCGDWISRSQLLLAVRADALPYVYFRSVI